jgi:DNA primase
MINNLLNKLNKVKRTSTNQYIACCPAHDDKSPSLSITDKGDGKILINCYAGCGTEDVLDSIGMSFEDIMPPKVIEHKVAPIKQKVYASDALKVIQLESRIVIMAAYELKRNKPMTEQDLARLELAMERINIASEMANV